MSKTLYVKNLTGFDLNIADLGVRIKAGTTIEVYSFNPYLTEEAIQKSLNSGYLYKGTHPDKTGKIHCQILKKPANKQQNKLKTAIIQKTPVENNAVLINPIEHIEDGGFLAVDYGFDTSMSKNLPTNLTSERIEEVKTLADFFNNGAKTLQEQKDKVDLNNASEVAVTQKVSPEKNVNEQGQKSVVMQIDETQPAIPVTEELVQEERPKIKTGKKIK